MNEKNHNNFLQKLTELSAGRDLFPWLMALGFTQATANRIKKGQPPSAELLGALMRSDRLSPRYLMEGQGAPYHVSRVISDDEAIEQLDELLVEDWAVALVTADRHQFVVVLHQPGQYQYKEKMIDYTIVEVVAGHITRETVQWLQERDRGVWLLELAPDDFQRLATGRMGNLELFGFKDARRQRAGHMDKVKSAINMDLTAVDPVDKVTPITRGKTNAIPSSGQAYDSLLEEIREVVQEVESILQSRGRILPPPDKARLIVLVFDHIHTRDRSKTAEEPVSAQIIRLMKYQ